MGEPKIPGGYYIKARRIQESSISRQPPHVREIWDYLLREANHSDKTYRGYSIKRGQLFRTLAEIREALSWQVGWRKMTYNENQTKKAMKFLREALMITTRKEPGGVMITISNYDFYQCPGNYESTKEGTRERTIDEPMKNQTAPYNKKKEEIEEGKEEENNIPDSVPDSGTRTEVENDFEANGLYGDERVCGLPEGQDRGAGRGSSKTGAEDSGPRGDNQGTGGGERSASQGTGRGMEGDPGTGGTYQGAGEDGGVPPGNSGGDHGGNEGGPGSDRGDDTSREGRGDNEKSDGEIDEPKYRTKKNRWLKGQKLADFEAFWKAFHEYGAKKNGKAPAADSWLNLKDYSPELVKWILSAAKQYAEERGGILQRGGTPKWAQGWLTDRRWEDYPPPGEERGEGGKIDVQARIKAAKERSRRIKEEEARKNGNVQPAALKIVKEDAGADTRPAGHEPAYPTLQRLFG